jgi:hypothetical protein
MKYIESYIIFLFLSIIILITKLNIKISIFARKFMTKNYDFFVRKFIYVRKFMVFLSENK